MNSIWLQTDYQYIMEKHDIYYKNFLIFLDNYYCIVRKLEYFWITLRQVTR
jgi:hypothetical protein